MSVPQHYELEFLGEKLTSTEGLFATIATITNFLCKFSDHTRVLQSLFILLRRLYNFFPTYRKHLEDTMILTFAKILTKRAGCANVSMISDPALRFKATQDAGDVEAIYENALAWITFLLESEHVSASFKTKILKKEQLKPFIDARSSVLECKTELSYHLPTQNFLDLDVSVAHPKIETIPAGKVFSFVVEISVENSIICINF